MNLQAVYHRIKQNWSYAYDAETLHIRLRTARGDMQRVRLLCGDKYDWKRTNMEIDMERGVSDALFDYWEARVRPPYKRLIYRFALHDGEKTVYYSEAGFDTELTPQYYKGAFDFPYLHETDRIAPPEWVKDAVFYQIFPERFANGDPSNDPDGTEPWGGEPTPKNFFGGDLQGVIDRLDYLTELGVNAIYFTPVFEATTNHKYDTSDYFRVDPHFGTNETLKTLVRECHARGIRVLLDAVFNHSGRQFAPFVDVIEKGEESPYKDWFHVRKWPLRIEDGVPTYETFAFEPIMPKLNTSNPEVRDYLLKVASYWMDEIGIDGWRLDVANEVDHQFWREFRQTVKKANPDAYILGEIMHDAMPWLQGDQFDAVMNYPFTNTVIDFFASQEIDSAGFAAAIGALLASYPAQVNEASFNLVGSHDTPRLLTRCGGDRRLARLAVLFQFTFVGVPCVYYGDEVGLDGGYDPGCRKCMEWDEARQDREQLAFYRALIRLRLAHRALRTGGFRFLQAEPGSSTLAYERWDERERFVILINRGGRQAGFRLPAAGTEWTDALSGESVAAAGGNLVCSLPPYGYKVLRSKRV